MIVAGKYICTVWLKTIQVFISSVDYSRIWYELTIGSFQKDEAKDKYSMHLSVVL